MNISYISQIPQKKEIISATKDLFIFNPEHDFALAVGNKTYTPPAKVLHLKNINALLPAKIAGDSDFILLPFDIDNNSNNQKTYFKTYWENLPYADIVREKNIIVIDGSMLPHIIHEVRCIKPWGWDHVIKKTLSDYGCPINLLPSDFQLSQIRDLSHRKTTIPLLETIYEDLEAEPVYRNKELFSLEEIELFLVHHPLVFFKAPWSSSGRGIVVSNHISRKGLLEWAHGILRRQGSIIAEPAWDKVIDFATEWAIVNHTPHFLGYSVFEASPRGKYHKNIMAPQDVLFDIITKAAPSFSKKIISAQEIALFSHIAPYYEGPLGIDMLVDKQGRVNPCVEVNLRYTMGHMML